MIEGDAVSWIRVPLGCCCHNPESRYESAVKCFRREPCSLTAVYLPRPYELRERFVPLALTMKAAVAASWIERLERLAARHRRCAIVGIVVVLLLLQPVIRFP